MALKASPRDAPPAQDVRERILDTAYDLLAEHGAAYLTQPRVSRAAGVRQSHLTYYFPRRSDLLVALARHSMEILAHPLIPEERRTAVGPALGEVFFQALTDRRRVRAVLGLIAAADEDPGVREALRDLVHRVRGRISELFVSLGLRGDPETIAVVHTFIVGAGVLHHARADDEARAEVQVTMRFLADWLSHARRGKRKASR